ncbi:Na+/H+ antiporter NhaC family protein [Brackiella oedipodis]|uniref:Na+/H+ antiporter NhaC family protein n=1 Tax=Brackiella oedipodis TaxID=124225 RepID=UPI00048C3116|nr:Na+/H+ antiporter NhaC family protein [Brackiella oedipodis]
MNAVVVAIAIVVVLSLLRISVVLSMVVGAVVGGLVAGLPFLDVVHAFEKGLGGGAVIALGYGTLGAFAVVLSRTGVTQAFADLLIQKVNHNAKLGKTAKGLVFIIFLSLIAMGFAAESIVPIHIAFIPIVVPPLLLVFNKLQLDRRAIACALTFSVVTMYMAVPLGYGAIYLNDILMKSINEAAQPFGHVYKQSLAMKAMAIPCLGMLVGALTAILFTYRKKRVYQDLPIADDSNDSPTPKLNLLQKLIVLGGIVLALVTQVVTNSMVFSGVVGFSVVSLSGVVNWKEQDHYFLQGMRLMAMIGFIMITANGFAEVMKTTGEIPQLVSASAEMIGHNKSIAALVMLIIGLLITLGIGSSFSTIPIIATIYVPMCIQFGFSPLATIALIGAAGALGDAGSPASDSTLGPSAALGADGQHNHIWDTVVPTFIHLNLPLIAAGWIAAMIL